MGPLPKPPMERGPVSKRACPNFPSGTAPQAGSLAMPVALHGVEPAEAADLYPGRLETSTVRAIWVPPSPAQRRN